IVQHERLGKHGQLGRSEFVLAVVADDHVLEQNLKLRREAGQPGKLGLQQFEFDDHVSEQLAARGVGKRAVVGQLLDLADVMQEGSGQNQIAIDLGIVPAEEIAGAEQGYDVIEQSADVGMMKRLGGRGIAVALGNLGVCHEELDQRLEVRILKARDKLGQGAPEFTDILIGFGKVVGVVDFRFFHAAQLVNRKL